MGKSKREAERVLTRQFVGDVHERSGFGLGVRGQQRGSVDLHLAGRLKMAIVVHANAELRWRRVVGEKGGDAPLVLEPNCPVSISFSPLLTNYTPTCRSPPSILRQPPRAFGRDGGLGSKRRRAGSPQEAPSRGGQRTVEQPGTSSWHRTRLVPQLQRTAEDGGRGSVRMRARTGGGCTASAQGGGAGLAGKALRKRGWESGAGKGSVLDHRVQTAAVAFGGRARSRLTERRGFLHSVFRHTLWGNYGGAVGPALARRIGRGREESDTWEVEHAT